MNLPYHSRRDFLTRNALGIGGVALSWMLSHQQTRASDKPHIPKKGHSFDLLARASHHAPQAKAMISLFMHGGPSHIDLLDPKPTLKIVLKTVFVFSRQFLALLCCNLDEYRRVGSFPPPKIDICN